MLEGHAFIVEAAVSLGGRDLRPGLNIYRFANRIPLLFEVHPPDCDIRPPSALALTARLGWVLVDCFGNELLDDEWVSGASIIKVQRARTMHCCTHATLTLILCGD